MLNLPNQDQPSHELEVNDFKFASEPLCSNNAERVTHNYTTTHSDAYRFFQKIFFFSFSSCPFAYQKNCKASNLLERLISFLIRLISICKTKNVMINQLEALETDELQIFLNKINKLKNAVKDSGYGSCDSSLLFVPYTKDDGTVSINIHFIDLAHGFKNNEEIEGHEENIEELVNSVEYLCNQVEKIINERNKEDQANSSTS